MIDLYRGVHEVLPKDETTLLAAITQQQRPQRIKMGFDPTRPDLHLGHYVGLRKLRQLQEYDHKIIIIIGDYTASIGDPSGRDYTRPPITSEEIASNTTTYLDQLFKVILPEKTEIHHQTDWYDDLGLAKLLRIAKTISVNQLLHREDFRNRYDSGNSITMTEMLYPILQGYDSVAVQADIELGGTDQMFNLLMGREIQKAHNQKQQLCITVPLLVGIDGVRKMSKSYDNYIALTDEPYVMYRKIMQIPDEQIPIWFNLLTNIPKNWYILDDQDPLQCKKTLANTITADLHGLAASIEAAERWVQEVSKKKGLTPTYFISLETIRDKGICYALMEANVISSKTEFKLLLKNSAMKLVARNDMIPPPSLLSQEHIMKMILSKWVNTAT